MNYQIIVTLAALALTTSFGYAYPNMQAPAADQKLAEKVFQDDSAYVIGEVLETIQVKSYTYIRMRPSKSKQEVWLATGKKPLEKGQTIRFTPVEPLQDFHSPTLDRTFKEIQFISAIEVAKKKG